MLTFDATEQINEVSRTTRTTTTTRKSFHEYGNYRFGPPDPGGLGVQGRICTHMTLRPKQATLIL